MDHGMIDVFAYQEALLVMAVFGVAVLAMIWVGFRRWLQHKEKMASLFAEQASERAAQHGTQMERVEARLKAIEQIVTDGNLNAPAPIDAIPSTPRPEPISKRDEV